MFQVHKIGGSLLDHAEGWRASFHAIAEAEGSKCLVISAGKGVTDGLERLIRLAQRGDSRELERAMLPLRRRYVSWAEALLGRGRELDGFMDFYRREEQTVRELLGFLRRAPYLKGRVGGRILALGERASARLASAWFQLHGIEAEVVDPRRMIVARGIGPRRIIRRRTGIAIRRCLSPRLRKGKIPVVPGFYARHSRGGVITLGRGGSDWTAAMLAEAIAAEVVTFWTDVPGLLTGPPDLVPRARVLPVIDGESARLAAGFGAKRFHPEALTLLVRAGIRARIRSPWSHAGEGTRISSGEACGSGPLLVAAKSPALVGRLELRKSGNQPIQVLVERIRRRFHPTAWSATLHPPGVQWLALAPNPVRAARRLRRLVPSSEFVTIETGGVVALIGRDLRFEELEASLGAWARQALVQWMTTRVIPFFVSQDRLASLVFHLHETLLRTREGNQPSTPGIRHAGSPPSRQPGG